MDFCLNYNNVLIYMGQLLEYGVEGSATILILVIAYKIYRMKINSSSKCCDDKVTLETQNSGNPPV